MHRWLWTSFLNLTVIAFIGVILRYKIAFSLPFVDQKHLLHAHSHFAFAGWITQLLMVLMIASLTKQGLKNTSQYRWILVSNLVTAYGMLVSFIIQGYGLFSIIFSTLSIFSSYAFTIVYWKDLNRLPRHSSHRWFKAALVFNVISSAGAFNLAFLIARHFIQQNWYLLSVYAFLHFQYNGWFFFACAGLLLAFIKTRQNENATLKKIFMSFFLSCFLTYFLSALWLPLPSWLYAPLLLAAISQIYGWTHLLILFYKKRVQFPEGIPGAGKLLILLSAIALSIKLLLQLASIYPPLNQLVFGFRPIVIGYLHLVFLGIISLFMIGYAVTLKEIPDSKKTNAGIGILVAGIFLNEVLLMIQGISALYEQSPGYINESLLGAAAIIFSGALLMLSGMAKLRQKLLY